MLFAMTLNVALIIVLLTAVAGAFTSGLLASLLDGGLNAFAGQRQAKTRGPRGTNL
jgi:hypothetical protein